MRPAPATPKSQASVVAEVHASLDSLDLASDDDADKISVISSSNAVLPPPAVSPKYAPHTSGKLQQRFPDKKDE